MLLWHAFLDLMPYGLRNDSAGGIRWLAEAQHGVVGRWQLALHRNTLAAWVRAGRLVEIQPGAYALGHSVLTRNGHRMAAVLSAGRGAVLSHRAAAALHALLISERTEVTTTRNVRRPFPVHRVRALPAEHVTTVDGIPCTTAMRTLADIAETATKRELERAIDNAHLLRLLDMNRLAPLLVARRRRPGLANLAAVLAAHAPGTTLAASRPEEEFLALVDAAALPRPELNTPLTLPDGTAIVADALYRAERLIVEIDAPATHDRPSNFESDRRRDAMLAVAGYRVVRFTVAQIREQPAYVVATLRALLGTRRAAI